MKTGLPDNIDQLNKSIQEYLSLRMDLIKLRGLEKITRISEFFISGLVFLLFGSFFFLIAAATFVVWYGGQFQDYLTGLLIVLGVIIVGWILFYFFRKRLIIPSIIKNISTILFQDDDDKE